MLLCKITFYKFANLIKNYNFAKFALNYLKLCLLGFIPSLNKGEKMYLIGVCCLALLVIGESNIPY